LPSKRSERMIEGWATHLIHMS